MGPETLESCVTALEAQVREIGERVRASEQDAPAARVLAGAADRDVAEIRGEIRDFRQVTVASFNALREVFGDLRTDFGNLRTDFGNLRSHVDRGFAEVDRGFTEMRGKLDAASSGQQQIVELIQTLIADRGGEQH